MAISKTLLFALLVALCICSFSSALPLSETLHQALTDDTDVGTDDELTSMPSVSPEVSAESSTAPTSSTSGATESNTPPGPEVIDGENPTASEEPSSSPSDGDEDEEVCVDAAYLSNIPAHQLVHVESFPSSVLCPKDSSLPCATAQHMLRYNGKALSYAGYCELVECEKKDNVLVNSVLSHKWVDEAHHDNTVHLTMFDARHPEATQKLLHRFIELKRKFI